MNRIYINTRHNEETRVIVVENNKLSGYEQESPGQENKKGNIYKGVVDKLQDNLEAAFVKFGEDKHGFLPLREIPPNTPGVSPDGLKAGDSLLVQIKKDNVGDKGAGLTGYISLAGCYLVLQRARGGAQPRISKHIGGAQRAQMQESLQSLNLPDGLSVILRTAGVGRTPEEIQWDYQSYLLKLWNAIEAAGKEVNEPMLIYQENNLPLRVVRDHFRPEENEIVCDDLDVYKEMREVVSLILPGSEDKVKRHDGDDEMIGLDIESQIDQIFEREITTPSGIRLVFDSAEALVAVDVNSGGLNSSGDIEETAFAVNMEAAEIIALQLRLRNLGGLVVVDFIDMEKEKNRQQLEKHFFQLLKRDRARINASRLSQFCLMEISRQRISRALVSSVQSTCSQCGGTGVVWQTEVFAMRLLRRMRAVTADSNVSALLVQAPSAAAVYLLNEKRIEIRKIEDANDCSIVIAPDEGMSAPQCNMRPINAGKRVDNSYDIVQRRNDRVEEARERLRRRAPAPQQQALIKTVLPDDKAPPTRAGKAKGESAEQSPGFLKRLTGMFFGAPAAPAAKPESGDKPQGRGRQPQRARQAGRQEAREGRQEQAAGGQRGRRGGKSERRKNGGGGERRARGGNNKPEAQAQSQKQTAKNGGNNNGANIAAAPKAPPPPKDPPPAANDEDNKRVVKHDSVVPPAPPPAESVAPVSTSAAPAKSDWIAFDSPAEAKTPPPPSKEAPPAPPPPAAPAQSAAPVAPPAEEKPKAPPAADVIVLPPIKSNRE